MPAYESLQAQTLLSTMGDIKKNGVKPDGKSSSQPS